MRDLSRWIDERERYVAVRLQQGRVELDADWGEQAAIDLFSERQLIVDLIGRHGAPDEAAGFAVTVEGDSLSIGPGHYWVDGILVHAGPDPVLVEVARPSPPFLVYLDVWERHISAVEDASTRDTALDEVDTSGRVESAWCIRVRSVGDRPPRGIEPTMTADAPEGYRGVENQLYRVEVHAGGTSGDAPTFKWSRENAGALAVLAVTGAECIGRGGCAFELEDGIRVTFTGGEYRTGDYWLIPARASGTIDWPCDDGAPKALPPIGIRHHEAVIARVERSGEVVDLRSLLPPPVTRS